MPDMGAKTLEALKGSTLTEAKNVSNKLAMRNTDCAIFEPSCPDDFTTADVVLSVLAQDGQFYFRRVLFLPSKWWMFWSKGKWYRTGEIWKPKSREFSLISLLSEGA